MLICLRRTIVFFNPLGQQRTEVVYVVVDTVNIRLTDAADAAIPCQINPVHDRFSFIVYRKFRVSGFVLVCVAALPCEIQKF